MRNYHTIIICGMIYVVIDINFAHVVIFMPNVDIFINIIIFAMLFHSNSSIQIYESF